jgi:hypothetical protein
MAVELIRAYQSGSLNRSTPEVETEYAYFFGLAVLLMFIAASGALTAWRWIVFTAAVFAALIAVNEVYVRWLEPLAVH